MTTGSQIWRILCINYVKLANGWAMCKSEEINTAENIDFTARLSVHNVMMQEIKWSLNLQKCHEKGPASLLSAIVKVQVLRQWRASECVNVRVLQQWRTTECREWNPYRIVGQKLVRGELSKRDQVFPLSSGKGDRNKNVNGENNDHGRSDVTVKYTSTC